MDPEVLRAREKFKREFKKELKDTGAIQIATHFLLVKGPGMIIWDFKKGHYRYTGKHDDKMFQTCPLGLEYIRYCLTVCQFCKVTDHEEKRILVCTHDYTKTEAESRQNTEDYMEMVKQVMEEREKEGIQISAVGRALFKQEHGEYRDDV